MKIGNLRVTKTRRGFTLVEVMVVMTIIALLIAILVPAIGYVREAARGTQCKSSLRQFYIGLTGFADKGRDGKYTTGSFDASRDGCPDAIGWVADMVNAKVCKPIELLCPSNPGQGSEKYKDILGAVATSASGENAPTTRQNIGTCSSAQTATSVADNFLAKGYGTNHMTTWFLVRSAPQTSGQATSTYGRVTVINGGNIKGNTGSKGPLKRRMVDQSPVTANTIPFMGDAAMGDVKDRFMDEEITGSDGVTYVTAGAPLVETSSDGPYFSGNGNGSLDGTFGKWGSASITLWEVSGTSATPTISGMVAKEQPPKGTAKNGNIKLESLQDFRDFGPVHGGGANVLFADGSVKSFQDLNGDGFLNPGFLVTGVGSGYAANDNTVELPEAEIFSGIALENFNVTNKSSTD